MKINAILKFSVHPWKKPLPIKTLESKFYNVANFNTSCAELANKDWIIIMENK